MQTAYLALGSNLGDRRALLAEALGYLAAAPDIRLARISPVYETPAQLLPGQAAQPDYLNLVVEAETTLAPHALLAACLATEQHLGRIRHERWGARTIDIDLLLVGDQPLDDPQLTLPHPRLTQRAFVLTPLADLAPDLYVNGQRVRDHLALVDRSTITPRPDLALSPPILLEEITLPESPADFFARLATLDHAFFLDSGRALDGQSAFSFIGFSPFAVIRSSSETPPNELPTLQSTLRRYARPQPHFHLVAHQSVSKSPIPALPFSGGAVGFFGYELCTQLEKLPRAQPDDLPTVPACEFALYDALIAHEHATQRTWLVANPVAQTPAFTLLQRLRSSLALPPPATTPTRPPIQPTANFDFSSYTTAVARIKDYIASGDVYQVNLTQRFTTPLPCTPYQLYQRLRRRSPAPYAAFLSFGDVQIISSSPECFLTLRGRHVETRPIKGTRPRATDLAQDTRLAAELLASEKDRAELLMIVDLERNDLGRVCEFGSVRVQNLWRLESHPTVHHLVSTVTGTLRSDLDAIDCIRATFPGGSITGAPKIRAMEIIDELEPHRRHVYTGAIGYIGFDGNADLNIAIRTITCVNQHAYYHVGGGIVWDSDPAAEYQETLDKGRAMYEALTDPT